MFFAHATEFQRMYYNFTEVIDQSTLWNEKEKQILKKFITDVRTLTYETEQSRLLYRNKTLSDIIDIPKTLKEK